MFSRLMSRFGQDILDNLFELIVEKETEVYCFNFICHNVPLLLNQDGDVQEILFRAFKFYLLKELNLMTYNKKLQVIWFLKSQFYLVFPLIFCNHFFFY